MLNRTLFRSAESGISVQNRYKMSKKIMKQLDKSGNLAFPFVSDCILVPSKYLDLFTSMVQSAINFLKDCSPFV